MMMVLTFCMGTDLDSIINNPIGQPLATVRIPKQHFLGERRLIESLLQIFYNSFGQRGSLAIWSFVVITQYMMGSSMV